MDMPILATRYGYASTRTSYGGYASPSHGYGHAPPSYKIWICFYAELPVVDMLLPPTDTDMF